MRELLEKVQRPAHGIVSEVGVGVPRPVMALVLAILLSMLLSCVSLAGSESLSDTTSMRSASEGAAAGLELRPVTGLGGAEEKRGLVTLFSPDASTRIATFLFASEEDTVRLPDRNVFVGSETVTAGGVKLDKTEYFLDCRHGTLFLRTPLAPDTQLVVEYKFVPFYVRPSYALREQCAPSEPAPAQALASLSPASRRSPGPPRSGLRLRGTKTFSLELGSNREASLKQSLQMNVTGEISKGLELNAVLTDRDLPIQPEGRTESVRQLDEIRVEMRSGNFSASMGDCDFVLDGASLLSVSRRLEGAKAAGRVAGVELVGAGSTLRGRWTSREFAGVDGKQGPYQLTTDAGSPCVVIGGTEAVWLDGSRLRRGESADYWMDYGSGRLYFTNANLIRSESRVRIEYEYSYGDYQKNFYAARAGGNLGAGGPRVDFTVVSESDDRALDSGGLTDEERSLLAELGDGTSDKTVEGAQYVGAGNGDYDLVLVDSSGVSVFEYVSDGAGAYVVDFVQVGQGKGSYVASADSIGKTYYVYLGPSMADYVPARKVVAPASKRVGDVRTAFSFKGVEFTGELAVSQTDLNTLSSLDDGDNLGKAALLGVRTSPSELRLAGRKLGRVSFGGTLRNIEENFLTFGNLNRAFDNETWAVPDTARLGRGERRVELETSYSPWENVSFSAAHGRLLSSSGLSSRRWAYASELRGRLSLSARLERALSEWSVPEATSPGDALEPSEMTAASVLTVSSSRTVRSVSSRLTGFRLVPSISYYSEVREAGGGPGVFINEGGGGLASAWSVPLSVRIEERYRVEHVGTPTDRVRSYDALTHTVGVQVSKWRSLSASCEYSLRDLHGYLGTGNRRTELGRLSVAQNPRSGKLSYEFNHHVTSLYSEQNTKNIIYVGVNEGHYDSTGTFVGRGDYEVVIVKLDAPALSSEAATSASLTLRPFKGNSKKTSGQEVASEVLESLTSSTLFRSSGTLSGTEGVFALLAEPAYTEYGSALRASALMREELEVAVPGRHTSLRYSFEISRHLNHQYENVSEKTEDRRNGVRMRSELNRGLTLELEQTWKSKLRRVDVRGGALSAGELNGIETTVDVRLLPVRNLELGLYSSMSGFQDAETGDGLRVYKVSPSITYGVQSSTRARLMCTVSSYDGRTEILSTASPVAVLEPNRVEIVFHLDHRAGEYLTFSTSVNSRKTTGSFVTDGRVEMRAHF